MKGINLPPILLGCSPFIGAGQFGLKSLYYYRKFHLSPRNMVKIFLKSFELGVEAVQLLGDKPIDALIEASNSSDVKPFVIYSTHLSGEKLQKTLDRLRPLEPEVIAIHAEIADRLDLNKISASEEVIRSLGISIGLATHRPGVTLPWIEKESVPVDVVLTPLNGIGYAMDPDFESSLEAIERCTRKKVGIKPLAGGRLTPKEGLTFVYRYLDSVAVGITSETEMRETYTIASELYVSKS